jgi:hypothetical protein
MNKERTISDVVEWILHNMDQIEDIVIVATQPSDEFGGFNTTVESTSMDFYKQLGMLEHAKEVMMYGEDTGEEI